MEIANMNRIREWFKTRMTKNRLYFTVLLCLLIPLLLLLLLSLIPAFRDFYADHIYPGIATALGVVMSVFPFAMGEILMYLAFFALLTAAVSGLLTIFLRKKKKYTRFVINYLKVLSCVLVYGLLAYTANWLIPFQSSVLGKERKEASREYTVQELRILYYYIVDRLNEECDTVPRDAEGNVIYLTKEKSADAAVTAMRSISGEYPRLSGYYPQVKYALCSPVLRWMSIGGFTYPYTMETTMNRYVTNLYFPTLFTHEFAHHKGYYRESEANFLSFIACSRSEEPTLRYSAYLYIFSYISDAYTLALDEAEAGDGYYDEIEEHAVKRQVWKDQNDQIEALKKEYESEFHPFEGLSDVAEEIAEKGWDTQAKVLGEDNYEGVVFLMLDHFDGVLY